MKQIFSLAVLMLSMTAVSSGMQAQEAAKKDAAEWQKTLHELKLLEGTPAPATR